jgi:hypothetical protein
MKISPSRLFELTKNVSNSLNELADSGIHVEIGDDFAKYRSYRNQQPDRGQIYPMFDVASSYIDRTNGFWVCGFNAHGELVHTQAVRLLDLADKSLATHLRTHRHKYITPDTTPDPDLTYYSGPKALNSITGKVCYQGDFWLRASGLGGPRSQGATSLLSGILLEIMISTWNPSYVFAFVPQRLAAKGAHLRYGYCHCEPGRWVGPDEQVTEEDYFIWMDAHDMASLTSRTTQNVKRSVSPTAVLPKVSESAKRLVDAAITRD